MKVVLALGVVWRNMLTFEVFSDAAMGAQCRRGHQGLVAVYDGGSLVQSGIRSSSLFAW